MYEVNSMATNRIPEEIKQFRPGPCTEIKYINGHYYVYSYSSVQLPSGKWGKKTGKSIGAIIPGKGFVPNRNFASFQGGGMQDDISVLEYGQYALLESVAIDVKSRLEKYFPLDRATQIFSYACILYANNFVHLDQVQRYYEQSWLSQENKSYSFKMGKTALGTLLDDLGRRTTRVVNFENSVIDDSASVIAIDGHAIRSCSDENDLAEAGYKYSALKEDQVNLLMGYDVESGTPLFAKMYRGSANDKSTIEDLTSLLVFAGILFVVDRGFYSNKNLELLSSNENSYIIPVPAHLDVFKNAMKNLNFNNSFYYRNGKKHARIEYYEYRVSDSEYIYVYRDIDENEKCRFNYLHSMELGMNGYTQEGFEENKELFGVYVLQTNAALAAEKVFEMYKKRWGIETFYQYLKNRGNYNDLMIQDYYKEQGFSFILLIAGQIHQKMISAVKALNDNTISVHDILLMARCMKMERRGNIWNLKNTRKRDLEILKKVGFTPVWTVND